MTPTCRSRNEAEHFHTILSRARAPYSNESLNKNDNEHAGDCREIKRCGVWPIAYCSTVTWGVGGFAPLTFSYPEGGSPAVRYRGSDHHHVPSHPLTSYPTYATPHTKPIPHRSCLNVVTAFFHVPVDISSACLLPSSSLGRSIRCSIC